VTRPHHDSHPVYLGVSLGRSLTFRQHATKTAAKINPRNNLITKLAGTSWGANAQTLRSSAVALCYSVVEYCVPAWGRSSHIKPVDRQLNETTRIVSGTIRPTPIQWLPVLSHISPPAVRCTELSANFIHNQPHVPVHQDIFNHPVPRLPYRRPVWSIDSSSSPEDLWRAARKTDLPANSEIIDDPTVPVPGADLPRREWCILNRFRSGAGRCAASLHQCGYTDNPLCVCGATQTMSHIVDSCPVYKFEGGLTSLHTASDSAVEWLCHSCML